MRPNILTTFGAGAVAAAVTLAGVGAGATAAGADEGPAYIAAASAQGLRSTYLLPGQVVVEEVYDFGGPVAQSRVDVSGGSGFASLPFPGAAGVVGAGLVLNLAGLSNSVPTPEYPFYAGAQYPSTPSAQVGDPAGNYSLVAKADEKASSAEATFRGGPEEGFVGQGFAHTDISEADGAVVAKAESINRAVSVGGGALTIGSVVSRVSATLAAGEAVKSTSELIVNGLEVAGTPAGVGPDSVDDDALNDALAAAGISVRLVHGEATATGVSADALEVRFTHPVPEGGGNEGTVVIRFGGATANIVTGSDPSALEEDGASESTPAQPVAPAGDAEPAAAAPVAAPVPAAGVAAAPSRPRPMAPEGAAHAAPTVTAATDTDARLAFEPVAAVSDPNAADPSAPWFGPYALLTVGAALLAASLFTWLRLGGTSWTTS